MGLVLDKVGRHVGGHVHLENVSLTLERGSLNVLLGPTLSGKTSLMRLMAGLDLPSAGRVLVDGVDVTGRHVRERSVAMVYQQFINYPSLTVYENIASPLRVARRPKDEIDRKVREAARLLKLDPYLERTPQQLSGGQQQRTAIARALVKEAQLVLLDEPLANLDYKLREELREELPKIFAATGAVFVYATTEPAEALLLRGNTATLWEGRLAQFGRTPDVYRRPANLTSARVFSDPPLNTMRVHKRGLQIVLATGEHGPARGVLAELPDDDYTIGFRADHLHLTRPHADAVALRGVVAVSEITGSESFVHIDLPRTDGGADRWVAVTRGVLEVEPGERIECFIDPRRLFVFGHDGRLAAAPPLVMAA
ncbi:ABC transporter ATP-binding protein [Roseomonas genomospecies 6]|uniref:ABC transporter ATP-binding protein n=1 Tax=Roseomonas genomospecies 6 TaxID=214106 RepID=A0A9W7TXP0_9PROT|nr:ABC transporter ATP-binding protein [Roseomonas genomospecies 6]KAA0680099.1 ABC transporter ATP-binding protein [Roseomonas genomospecies 6]